MSRCACEHVQDTCHPKAASLRTRTYGHACVHMTYIHTRHAHESEDRYRSCLRLRGEQIRQAREDFRAHTLVGVLLA